MSANEMAETDGGIVPFIVIGCCLLLASCGNQVNNNNGHHNSQNNYQRNRADSVKLEYHPHVSLK